MIKIVISLYHSHFDSCRLFPLVD